MAWVMVVVGVALAVRVYHIGEQDYWLDELHSMADSAGSREELDSIPTGQILHDRPRYTDLSPQSSLTSVWHTMRHDSHPPIYFVSLHLWRRAFGDTTMAVRVLSALFSALSILFFSLMLREFGFRREAPAAAVILGLSFSHIYLAQQNRPYSLGLFLLSVSFWLVARMQSKWGRISAKEKPILVGGYGLSMYLAMMTHYFVAFPLMAQTIYILWRFRSGLRRACIGITVAAAGLWILTWGRQFLGQQDFIASQDWLLEQRPDHAVRTLMRLTDLPLRLLFAHQRFSFDLARSAGGGLILAGSCWLAWRSRSRGAVLFLLWYFVPTVAFGVLDMTTDRQLLSHIRYVSLAGPALVGLLVVSFGHLSRLYRRIALGVFLLAVLVSLRLPAQDNPHAKTAAQLIQAQRQPHDLLIYDAVGWPSFWATRLYHIISYHLPRGVGPFVLIQDPPEQELMDKIARFPRLIVVSPRPEDTPNPLPDLFQKEARSYYIKGIGWLYLFTPIPTQNTSAP